MIKIDGSVLEGGGQILRMSVALSALLSKEIQITDIRMGRSQPGLRAQHLVGMQLVQQLTAGQLINGNIGATNVTFKPQRINCGHYLGDTKTAGSITLLCQIALPCMLFANGPTLLRLKGGTNADMAPQIDYTLLVLKPLLEKFGVHFEVDLIRRGYFPKGGGEVVIKCDATKCIQPVILMDQGDIVLIKGYSFVAGVLPIKVAHSMADSAEQLIRKSLPHVKHFQIERVKENPSKAFGNGSGIVLVAETTTGCLLSGSALGKRDKPSEVTGEEAARELIEDITSGGAVDRHTQDQLIIFMALANGTSSVKTGPITLHTQTAIHVAKLLCDAKFQVIASEDEKTNVIKCDGIAHTLTN